MTVQMLLDNIIASGIAIGCAIGVGIIGIVIAYVFQWMVHVSFWMAQLVFLFFFPYKPIKYFGELWYPMWRKWKDVTIKLAQDTNHASASGNTDAILHALNHAKIQIYSMWYTLEHGITLAHRDEETERIANDVQEWSKALLRSQLDHISSQIAYIVNSDSSEESTLQHIQFQINRYREDVGIYREEVRESERAMHAHRVTLKLQSQNVWLGSLAILLSLIAIVIASC